MKRREVLKASTYALAGLSLLPAATRPRQQGARFDHAALKAQARALAANPYAEPATTMPPAVAKLDWDKFQSIGFRHERALWAGAGSPFRVEFFHLGMQFRRAVRMHEVVDGVAR
ncbi:MAG TPA: glucan biosynthesis protein, partial [Rhodanobacteraceae bacterium]|nr:glucan biosynthesis protein [Rhodanobacteraceae bacterium]